MKHYLESRDDVLRYLGSSSHGLTAADAAARIEKYGYNKIKEETRTSWFLQFIAQIRNPMILILLAAALLSGVSAVYAHESYADVIIILAVVLTNAFLGIYQENKAEKAIEALQRMSAATCRVLRDTKTMKIKSEELVPGDVILLEAGDAVPADGRLLECHSLQLNESALTGESVPVVKQTEAITAKETPLGERSNMIYMASDVVYGRGSAVVTATGDETEMGKIANALRAAEKTQTPLQIKLNQLSKVMSGIVLGVSAFVFLFSLLRMESIDVRGVLSTLMIAVSLAVAAIPEGLAAVVTVVLSIGVTNLSKRNAIIRKLTAVETLGCAQIICSDKTGTLTQNKMTVVEYWPQGNLEALAKAMTLCSDAILEESGAQGEPTECALVNFAAEKGYNKNELQHRHPRVAEIPFDSVRKMMSTLHQDTEGFIQYTKGATDELLSRCGYILENGKIVALTEGKRAEIQENNRRMAKKALRVLAAASRVYQHVIPKDQNSEELEKELCFLGLTGMIDPVRPEAKAAIERCKEAGIRAVMITGDHRDTAVAIGTELGIIQTPDQAISGAELDGIDDAAFEKSVRQYGVYARVQPEHKVRIVKAWQKQGCVTAMTGDGVNDAPALKNADIGVGMGITGTDVTKNVADMVLADDHFATIVSAVEEGRRIYDNIRKTIQFLLSANMSEVLSILAATFMGFTILKPVHLLWINLITDTLYKTNTIHTANPAAKPTMLSTE